MTGNQYFILPAQPDPKDKRPRNAFGFLIGFGLAYKAYYDKQDKLKAKVKRQTMTATVPKHSAPNDC